MTDDGPRRGVLVVGGSGTLGTGLCAAFAGRPLLATSRAAAGAARLDLVRDADGWPIPTAVDVAYLLAAVTSIEHCRRRPEETRRVNVDATVRLATRLVHAGLRVVFPSTSMAFDGESPFPASDTPPSPHGEYGRQKAMAEGAILALGDPACVVRFTKILTPNSPMITAWRRDLVRGIPIEPFADLPLSPIPLSRAVAVLRALADRPIHGVLHVSAAHDVTWADVARRLADRLDVDPRLVRPVPAAPDRVEHLPRHASLGTAGTDALLGLPPIDPYESIDAAIAGTDAP
jgi:dTDP-4-dehydrorhamnose reductase